uniref:AAA+ ATPase domain-containing protein n=1 Tax=viral metagenome TaxID=1070528 RepID=A0A6C0KY89_9ZZZZ
MDYKLFINKYQPVVLTDFEIENEMIEFLLTLVKMNNLNILFVGGMGFGKTSLLNTLIREYYKGFDDNEYENNVLYINNLKEQGINYYRNDVKTFCQTCSLIKNKKKIIVLDDIDLINEQSQQVFRNCIDKFSHNVHFMASCNNIQKVIENLQSRFTIIKIKPLQIENLDKIINKICENEGIIITQDARNFILEISNNTAKILINYLEKFKLLNQEITLELAKKVCTNISFCSFQKYTEFLISGNLKEAIKLLYSIYDKGYSVMDILDNYFLFIKSTDIISENIKYELIPFICKYITIFHNIHEDEIELSLFTNNITKIIEKIGMNN